MPLQATSGAASYDAFGGGVAAVPNYIEDVFSTYLYTGTSPTNQTITNNIDLSGKGGLVWFKRRDSGSPFTHELVDTVQGAGKFLSTPSTSGWGGVASDIQSFNSNGFTINDNTGLANTAGASMVSWTFRKQPKFFDVVTWSGNNANPRVISHNLGSVPGSMFIKATSTTGDWFVYHRSFDGSLRLNTTAAGVGGQPWYRNDFTSTTISVTDTINATGVTYVAYLFAHNAGGFGLTGTDNVISCGSFTGAATVNLGWEPQFILYKTVNVANDWKLVDNTRGLVVDNGSGTGDKVLKPNLTNAELGDYVIDPTSTGFIGYESVSNTHIYIAIRRGPMKVPTSGTSVFAPLAVNNAVNTQNTTGFPIDLQIRKARSVVYGNPVYDRLRGMSSVPSSTSIVMGPQLFSNATSAEAPSDDAGYLYDNTSWRTGQNWTGSTAYWNFGRAPSFFDVVCYTGTGSARTVSHNLGVAPELMIVKARVSAGGANRNWAVYASSLGAGTQAWLNTSDAAFASSTIWANTSPTASVFSVSTNVNTNYSGATYVAYLFATCAGVSKVGSYTGNGSTQTINCGFTGGARFVLIKSTTAVESWHIFDTARGMVAGTDPRLRVNTTDSELNSNWVYTATTGFEIVTSDAAVNGTGQTYIFLAIA